MSNAPSQSSHKMIGIGLAAGAGIGSALGVVFGNIPIGVAVGVHLAFSLASLCPGVAVECAPLGIV